MLASKKAESGSSYFLIREMAEMEKPREKLLYKGAASLSDAELLALLMGTGLQGVSVIDLARDLLKTFDNSLARLANASIEELCQVKGIGPAKATTLQASFELLERLRDCEAEHRPLANSALAAAKYLRRSLCAIDHEEFRILLIDSKMRIVRNVLVSRGILDRAPVHPREVFREAVKAGTANIILAHNHPSGDCTPSKQDIHMTEAIIEAGELMKIPVLDHLVLGKAKKGEDKFYCSMREESYVSFS